MRVLLFGAGKMYQDVKQDLRPFHIMAIIDNDKKKQGKILDGHPIISPDQVNYYPFDYIVLTNSYQKDTKKKLIELGVDEEKIAVNISELFLRKLYVRKVKVYRNLRSSLYNNAKRVLLISHDLSEGGAQNVLLNMARCFAAEGFNIEVFAIGREKILYEFLKIGAQVSIYDEYNFTEEEMKNFKGRYDLVVANTLLVYDMVLKFSQITPVLWWIHESNSCFESCQIKRKEFDLLKKVNIFAGGERVQKSFYQYAGYEIPVLRYGIPLKYSEPIVHEQFTFALIGYEEYRKGVDVYVRAIEKNGDKWDEHYRFLVIGNTLETKKMYSQCNKVEFLGQLSNEELDTLYGEIDVLVCPSRDDPEPMVVTEAMMRRKCCIISDQTGQAMLIKNYKEGIICKSGDVDSLAECIQWSMEHENIIKEIGEKAFEFYKKFFSIEIFDKKINEIVTEII